MYISAVVNLSDPGVVCHVGTPWPLWTHSMRQVLLFSFRGQGTGSPGMLSNLPEVMLASSGLTLQTLMAWEAIHLTFYLLIYFLPGLSSSM